MSVDLDRLTALASGLLDPTTPAYWTARYSTARLERLARQAENDWRQAAREVKRAGLAGQEAAYRRERGCWAALLTLREALRLRAAGEAA